jgi:hypothetical protein
MVVGAAAGYLLYQGGKAIIRNIGWCRQMAF